MRGQARALLPILLLLVGVIVVSCNDDSEMPTTPADDDSFSVRLSVSGPDSLELTNLRVSCWNKLSMWPPMPQPPGTRQNGSTALAVAVTSFAFVLDQTCDYELTIRDLDGNEIEVVSSEGLAGYHSIDWSVQDLHSGAYPYTLVAISAETGDTVLNETKYAYHYGIDPADNVIGYLDSSGVFQTTERSRFSNLYGVPELPFTDETAAEVGVFNVLDTVRFVLEDTVSGDVMWFDSLVVDSQQAFSVAWNPTGLPIAAGTVQPAGGGDLHRGPGPVVHAAGDALPGDLDLNGTPFEQSDIDIFTDYFCNGLDAFTLNVPDQVLASDANEDGVSLQIDDFAYMVLGGPPLVPAVGTVTTAGSICNGVLTIDAEVSISAAFVEAAGTVTPELLAENMQLCYSEVEGGTKTRIFVYSLTGESFNGAFLRVNSSVLQIDMANVDGNPVEWNTIPCESELFLNFPNPF